MKHTYRYVDGRLYSEEWDNHVMVFLYNDMGVPIGMRYRTTEYAQFAWDTYWYERNLQGDIVGIYNRSNVKLASYTYDAWGNHTPTYSNGGANIVSITSNPLRYRGYYYDADLGLYYLQSRYYDSNTGRFINADGYISTGTGILGYNMYAYCNNNPVMCVDSAGNSPGLILGLVVLGALVVLALTSCSPSSSEEPEAPSNINEDKFTYNYVTDTNGKVDGSVNYSLSDYTNVYGVTAPEIKIHNSGAYRDENDQRAILSHIINSPEGQNAKLSMRDIDYYVKEWKAHNYALDNPQFVGVILQMDVQEVIDHAEPAQLNTNDPRALAYNIMWEMNIYGE